MSDDAKIVHLRRENVELYRIIGRMRPVVDAALESLRREESAGKTPATWARNLPRSNYPTLLAAAAIYRAKERARDNAT